MVLTHGHEDHVGALPYLIREIGVPEVWATRLTLGLIKSKLDEHGLIRADRVARDRPARATGADRAVRASSSSASRTRSPTPSAVVLHTAQGTIVHTGDYQARPHADRRRAAPSCTASPRSASAGVDAAPRPTRRTPSGRLDAASEQTVAESLERIIRDAPGRVIVTSFASHIHRLQEVVDAAESRRPQASA